MGNSNNICTFIIMFILGMMFCPVPLLLQSPDQQQQWVYVKFNFSTVSRKHIAMERRDGTMNILNESIKIRCDGHYLFFLKGTIYLQQSSGSLMLRVKNSQKQQQQQRYLLDVICSAQKTLVTQVTVSVLLAQDEISLEANQTGTPQDLSLVLTMITPHSYCFPEKT